MEKQQQPHKTNNNTIDNLLKQVNISNIISENHTLVKAGASYKIICPKHDDRSPSLSINPSKQIYKCFVCDHGGNALDFLMWAEDLSYRQAVEKLVNNAGANLNDYLQPQTKTTPQNPKVAQLIELCKLVSAHGAYQLDLQISENNNFANWFKQRQFNSTSRYKFQLGMLNQIAIDQLLNKTNVSLADLIILGIANEKGYAIYQSRLVFPVFDDDGNVISFSGRLTENHPQQVKYLHGPTSLIFSKNKVLYNYHQAKTAKQIYICEGFADVISADQIGFHNTIALLGVDCSDERLATLSKHDLILCLDNDPAGQLATINLIKKLLAKQARCQVVSFNNQYKDLDEWIKADPESAKVALKNPINDFDFIYWYYFKDISQVEQLTKPIQAFSQLIQLGNDPLLKQIYQNKIKSQFAIDVDFSHYQNQQESVRAAVNELELLLIGLYQHQNEFEKPENQQLLKQLFQIDWQDPNKWNALCQIIFKQQFSPKQISHYESLVKSHYQQISKFNQVSQLIQKLSPQANVKSLILNKD